MIQATENLSIGDLISRRVPFIVPKYQRAYAWEDEEIDEFVNDIRQLYLGRITPSSRPMPHFWGGLVSVNRIVGNTSTGRVLEIVDGQQRLATFMLTMVALTEGFETIAATAKKARDTATENAARSYLSESMNAYIEYDEVVSGTIEKRLRLQLSRADNMYFEQLLRNQGTARTRKSFPRASHRRLLRAWDTIYSELIESNVLKAKTSTADQLSKLLVLRACILQDCYLIHIVSDDLSEAYRLFTVLNDRGKTLSDGDLLRSYTLEGLEGQSAIQDQVEAYWDAILSYKESDIAQFLRTFYTSRLGAKPPSRDLANAFRMGFFKTPGLLNAQQASDLRDIIQSMSEDVVAFDAISDGRWPYETPTELEWDISRLPRLIKVLKHTICMPLLLSAHRWLSEKQFAEIVLLLERFSFRYITIVGAHAGKLGEAYASHAKQIKDNPHLYKIADLQSELRTLQSTNAPDAQFEVGLKTRLLYTNPSYVKDSNNSSPRMQIRHFLTTIEDFLPSYSSVKAGNLKPDKSRMFALDQVTIEHIYPQNPTTGNVDPKLAPYTHTIGNLSFWGPGENSSAGNMPFSGKTSKYASSHVLMNNELAKLTHWDETKLLARQAWLIAIAQKVFTA